MRLVSAGVRSGFGLGRVVASLLAVKAVAEPRATAIPAEGAGVLSPVAGAGLVGASHNSDTVIVVSSPNKSTGP